MSEPILTDDQLMRWIGAFQVVFGWICVVYGMRRRRRRETGGRLAPMGAGFAVAGLLMLLNSVVADYILIPAGGVAALAAVAWFVREYRASGTGPEGGDYSARSATSGSMRDARRAGR